MPRRGEGEDAGLERSPAAVDRRVRGQGLAFQWGHVLIDVENTYEFEVLACMIPRLSQWGHVLIDVENV